MATTDAPVRPSSLPDVLPTDRLLVTGKPVPELRGRAAPHRHRPQRRHRRAASGPRSSAIVGGRRVDRPPARPSVAAFVLMGPCLARLAILGHEAAHRLLFPNKRANDVVGRWLLVVPGVRARSTSTAGSTSPTTRTSSAPTSPTSTSTPATRSPRRRCAASSCRDARGISGWKNLKGLLRGAREQGARPVGARGSSAPRSCCSADLHRSSAARGSTCSVARPVDDGRGG